jgi:hypothetical protein
MLKVRRQYVGDNHEVTRVIVKVPFVGWVAVYLPVTVRFGRN